MASRELNRQKPGANYDRTERDAPSKRRDTLLHRGTSSIEERVGLLIAAHMHYRRTVRKTLAGGDSDSH
jgi:hypothetical protein